MDSPCENANRSFRISDNIIVEWSKFLFFVYDDTAFVNSVTLFFTVIYLLKRRTYSLMAGSGRHVLVVRSLRDASVRNMLNV